VVDPKVDALQDFNVLFTDGVSLFHLLQYAQGHLAFFSVSTHTMANNRGGGPRFCPSKRQITFLRRTLEWSKYSSGWADPHHHSAPSNQYSVA
jgi:hypothetical protein